jgi:hypothetical protein
MTIAAQWLLDKQRQARVRRLCEIAVAIALGTRSRREVRRDSSTFINARNAKSEQLRREVGR